MRCGSQGREDIFEWWTGPGAACRGSRLIPTFANGAPAFAQYKRSTSGDGFDPWAIQVLEISDGRIVDFTFFLDTARLFPLFGLPLHLDRLEVSTWNTGFGWEVVHVVAKSTMWN